MQPTSIISRIKVTRLGHQLLMLFQVMPPRISNSAVLSVFSFHIVFPFHQRRMKITSLNSQILLIRISKIFLPNKCHFRYTNSIGIDSNCFCFISSSQILMSATFFDDLIWSANPFHNYFSQMFKCIEFPTKTSQ